MTRCLGSAGSFTACFRVDSDDDQQHRGQHIKLRGVDGREDLNSHLGRNSLYCVQGVLEQSGEKYCCSLTLILHIL